MARPNLTKVRNGAFAALTIVWFAALPMVMASDSTDRPVGIIAAWCGVAPLVLLVANAAIRGFSGLGRTDTHVLTLTAIGWPALFATLVQLLGLSAPESATYATLAVGSVIAVIWWRQRLALANKKLRQTSRPPRH